MDSPRDVDSFFFIPLCDYERALTGSSQTGPPQMVPDSMAFNPPPTMAPTAYHPFPTSYPGPQGLTTVGGPHYPPQGYSGAPSYPPPTGPLGVAPYPSTGPFASPPYPPMAESLTAVPFPHIAPPTYNPSMPPPTYNPSMPPPP